jgi:hypothetical protein
MKNAGEAALKDSENALNAVRGHTTLPIDLQLASPRTRDDQRSHAMVGAGQPASRASSIPLQTVHFTRKMSAAGNHVRGKPFAGDFNTTGFRFPARDTFTMQGAFMSALRMFIPITKVDAARRLVYGLATAETEDRAGEIRAGH